MERGWYQEGTEYIFDKWKKLSSIVPNVIKYTAR